MMVAKCPNCSNIIPNIKYKEKQKIVHFECNKCNYEFIAEIKNIKTINYYLKGNANDKEE